MNQRVPLSFLLTENKDEEPPVEPKVPFAALYGHAPKIVTAVLERTAVLAEPSDRYERISVRHDQVLVDPSVIEWRVKTASYEGARLNGEAKKRLKASKSPWRVEMATTYSAVEGTRASQRQASDERALKNQKEVAASAARERTILAIHRGPSQAAEGAPAESSIDRGPGSLTKAWRAERAELESQSKRRCSNCREIKATEAFVRDSPECKECRNAYQRNYWKRLHPKAKPYGERPSQEEDRELQFLRRRATEQAPEQKEKEEVSSAVNTNPAPGSFTTTTTTTIKRLKACRRCGEPKASSEFTATGIYGGYCVICEPIEKAERAAARGKPARAAGAKTKRGYVRRAKSEKATDKIGAEVSSNGYDHVVKLLHRRDSLKLELAKVTEQLQEALA